MNADVWLLLVGLALGWLTLASGLWLSGKARREWRRRHYGEPLDHQVLLVKYGRQMTGTLDQQALGQLLTAELPRALQVDRAVLLMPRDHQLADVAGGELSLPVSHAGVRWVASSGEAQIAGRGRLRELIQDGRTDLTWTGVWVPLMRGVDLRGMWLLGKRAGGFDYSAEDLAYLTNLGRQAGVVLETIRYAEQEQQAASEIRALYQRVVAAQEVERRRLSRDLHDSVLQDLCAVNRDLKALETQSPGSQNQYTDLTVRSGEAVQTLRGICNDLRPPLLQHDLAAALKALVEQVAARSRPSVYITLDANEVRLPDEVATAVFRITQEALNNAIQHADASEIEVRLTTYPDRLRLTVTDDGRGIPGSLEPGRFVAQGHLGLAGMRERAAMIGAKLEVQSATDYGTAVVLEIPT